MNTPRDYLSLLRWRAANGRTHASNAWHRAAGNRIHGARIGLSNRRNRRTLDRGRAPRLSGASAAISSRTPFYRNRINRSTGRKNRDNGFMHRTRNEGLARMKTADRTDLARIAAPAPRGHPEAIKRVIVAERTARFLRGRDAR